MHLSAIIFLVSLVSISSYGIILPRILSKAIVASLPLMITTQPPSSLLSSSLISSTMITAKATSIDGSFSDPFHPGCKRVITKQGDGKIKIEGSDNVDGSNPWVLFATEDEKGNILVDFSPKGGPKNILGMYILRITINI